MKKRLLGRTGIQVSEICMGTMTFGSMADEGTSLRILDKAFDAGIDFLDTAEMYPVPPDPKWVGRTEEICGKWLQGRSRDSVIIATKAAGPAGGWFQTPLRGGRTALDRHHIERAIEASLRKLGTDYVDLYQTHWPDPNVPIEDTLEALDRLVESGKVRAVGCSNETCLGLVESLWQADRNGTVRYETIQNNFSLLNRRFEDELGKACRKHQVSLLPYSPLAGGVLSGKYQGGAWPEGARFSGYRDGSPRTQTMTKRFVNPLTLESTERLTTLATDLGLSTVTLSVAWTLTKDYVASTIIGATDPDQLDDCLAAADVRLEPATLQAINQISTDLRYPMG